MASNSNKTFCVAVCPWAIRQLKQPSTWRGLTVVAGLLGVHINPAIVTEVATATGAIIAAIDIIKNDTK